MPGTILAVVDDLFFLAKIQETGRRVGIPVEQIDPRKVQERLGQSAVSVVILDLNHRSGAALDVLKSLKGDASTRHVPVIGFVSHVQGDLVAAARAAGCDQVLARSAFSVQLPELLEKLGLHGAVGSNAP